MTEHNDLDPTTGISRRRILARGAVLGGVVWAAPAVTTVGGSAFGQTAGSPPPIDTGISYIALNVTCGGQAYFIKWEDGPGWEANPSLQDTCEGVLTQNATSTSGATLAGGFTVTDAGGTTDCVIITVPATCTVTGSAIKYAQTCVPGATGTGELTFCRVD